MTDEIGLQKDLSGLLVGHFCPEELPILDATFPRLKDGLPAAGGRTDPLGSGLGEYFALATLGSTLLVPLATWLAKDVIGKAFQDVFVEKLKVALKRTAAGGKNGTAPAAEVTGTSPDDLRMVAGVVHRVREQAKILGSDPQLVEQVVLHLSIALPMVLVETRSKASR